MGASMVKMEYPSGGESKDTNIYVEHIDSIPSSTIHQIKCGFKAKRIAIFAFYGTVQQWDAFYDESCSAQYVVRYTPYNGGTAAKLPIGDRSNTSIIDSAPTDDGFNLYSSDNLTNVVVMATAY